MDVTTTGTTMRFSGRFTFADHDGFQKVVTHISTARKGDVTLDLGGLEFIDSAGLGMLLMAREVAEEKGVRMVLRGAKGAVARMLEVTCFDTVFAIQA